MNTTRSYRSQTRVIYADTDAMGVAYHANYIKWFEIGRTEYLRQIGYPYAQLEKEGVWLPVTEVDCKYIRPARYDDVLDILCRADELGGASVVMAYEVRRRSDGDLLARGKTRHAVTDPSLKPIKLKKTRPDLYDAFVRSTEDA